MPSIQFFYVCNKVEDDQDDKEMDRFSDSDSADDDPDDDDSDDSKRDRGKLAFIKLQKARLLDQSLPYAPSVPVAPSMLHRASSFHAISCKEIRSARVKKRTSVHMDRFRKLKDDLIQHFSFCVNAQLSQALSNLHNLLKRQFDFLISDRFQKMRLPKDDVIHTVRDIKAHVKKIYNDMDLKVQKHWFYKIEKMLFRRLENKSNTILGEATRLEFKPIIINDQQSENHLINECRIQVRDFVLMMAIEDFERQLAGILSEIHRIWQRDSRPVASGSINYITEPRMQAMLQNHLTLFWQRDDISFDVAALKDVWVASLSDGVRTRVNVMFENMKFAVTGIYLNAEWKKSTAAAVIRSIDPHSLALHIVCAIRDKLKAGNQVIVKLVFVAVPY